MCSFRYWFLAASRLVARFARVRALRARCGPFGPAEGGSVQSIWVQKGHLALGKVFAAGPYRRLMVRDAASSKLCGPCAPNFVVLARRPRAPSVFPNMALSFLLAWVRAQACARPPRTPRTPGILMHCLKESSRKKLLNALVKSVFWCEFIEKRAKNIADLRRLSRRGSVRVAADSKLCCPLASSRPWWIPNLASLLAVHLDANLTV